MRYLIVAVAVAAVVAGVVWARERSLKVSFGGAMDSARSPALIAAAEAAWVDPATLRREAWTPGLIGDPPCAGCGHPRWAHATAAMYDGPCIVPGCDDCQSAGYGPGYEEAS